MKGRGDSGRAVPWGREVSIGGEWYMISASHDGVCVQTATTASIKAMAAEFRLLSLCVCALQNLKKNQSDVCKK